MAALTTGGNVFRTLARRNKLMRMELIGLRRGKDRLQEDINIVKDLVQELRVEIKELEQGNQELSLRLAAIKQHGCGLHRFLSCFGIGQEDDEEEDLARKGEPEKEEVKEVKLKEKGKRLSRTCETVASALAQKKILQEELEEEKRTKEEMVARKQHLMKKLEELKEEKEKLEKRKQYLNARLDRPCLLLCFGKCGSARGSSEEKKRKKEREESSGQTGERKNRRKALKAIGNKSKTK